MFKRRLTSGKQLRDIIKYGIDTKTLENEYDYSGITSFSEVFSDLDIKYCPDINMASVLTADSMFGGCTNLKSVRLYNMNKIVNVQHMFSLCSSLKSVRLEGTWAAMPRLTMVFHKCSSLEEVYFESPNKTQYFENCFQGCTSLKSAPKLDLGNAINTSFMFDGCKSLESASALSGSSTNIRKMFNGCRKLKEIPDKSFFDKVTRYDGCFDYCESLEEIPFDLLIKFDLKKEHHPKMNPNYFVMKDFLNKYSD